MIKEINDEEIIQGIINDDSIIMRHIYKKYYSKIKGMVLSFRNIILDPDDIFQEGLTRAILNIRQGRFEGRSSFYTYLTGICRNICLKELKVMKNYELHEEYTNNVENDEVDYDMIKLIIQIKEKLDHTCREIINLRFGLKQSEENYRLSNKNMQFEEIAKLLDIKPANARQRFKRCLEKLHGIVVSNPMYKELTLV